MPHYMNPFDFVPLPPQGPIPIPEDILNQPRVEGYVDYSIKTLTPLHIAGKTTRQNNHYWKKYFLRQAGNRVIPGASIRGMVSAFLEALTGSDLRSFARGDEQSQGGAVYGKRDGHRHVGFLIASGNDPSVGAIKSETFSYNYRGRTHTRKRYERNETLPDNFGRNEVEDVAKFMFGHVDQEGRGQSRKGRVFFEDIVIDDNIQAGCGKVWDLNSDAVFGSPNPRANTAWYFTPNGARIRNVAGGRFRVWEVLADKVRGRKFYFHQYPERCHNEYKTWKQGWMPQMVEYDVETIPAKAQISGRVYFTDMPEALLLFLVYGLRLDEDMAHKLGALKPFGFGSVKISIEKLSFRKMGNPFEELVDQGISGNLDHRLIFSHAYDKLKKIMHFPDANQSGNYIFMYPPFNPKGKNAEAKGFAHVESVNNKNQHKLTLGTCSKTTMYFDKYQKSSVNYDKVMR